MEDEDIVFKEEITGLDYIMSLDKIKKEVVIEQLRILCVILKEPKLSYEELLALNLDDFNKILTKYMARKNRDLTPQLKKPSVSQMVGKGTTYIFPPPMSIISKEEPKE